MNIGESEMSKQYYDIKNWKELSKHLTPIKVIEPILINSTVYDTYDDKLGSQREYEYDYSNLKQHF